VFCVAIGCASLGGVAYGATSATSPAGGFRTQARAICRSRGTGPKLGSAPVPVVMKDALIATKREFAALAELEPPPRPFLKWFNEVTKYDEADIGLLVGLLAKAERGSLTYANAFGQFIARSSAHASAERHLWLELGVPECVDQLKDD
jgi:hypothetical protein